MKDGFHITIETIHIPNDVGKQENVSRMPTWSYMCSSLLLELVELKFLQVHSLPKELLSKRDVVHVDIVNDPVSAQVHVHIIL